jgi:hypothetical protein
MIVSAIQLIKRPTNKFITIYQVGRPSWNYGEKGRKLAAARVWENWVHIRNDIRRLTAVKSEHEPKSMDAD